jgi:membrane fusion protein, multidrug efflux system
MNLYGHQSIPQSGGPRPSLLDWLALALVLMLAASCKPPKTQAPPTPKVTVAQPHPETVTNWDEYPGHLEAVETVELRSRVAGYLDSIHFKDGAEVKAGDLLFVIDPRPFRAELDRAQALYQQAATRLELTRKDLQRAEALRGTKAISEEEYDTRRNDMRLAEGALAAAEASQAVAQLNVDYTQVKAPISGRIGRRLLTAGNYIQLQGSGGSATLLATVVSQDPIYCYFDVQEESYLQYCRSADAPGGIPCEVGLVNEPGFPHQGHIDFVDNQVDPRTGTIRLRAVFSNPDRALVPGFFARVRVLAGEAVQCLLIPDVAVGSDQGRKFVFVVNGENTVETRPIQIGRQYGAMRAVLEGLKAEDRVVVNGLMMVRPGSKVEVQGSTATP